MREGGRKGCVCGGIVYMCVLLTMLSLPPSLPPLYIIGVYLCLWSDGQVSGLKPGRRGGREGGRDGDLCLYISILYLSTISHFLPSLPPFLPSIHSGKTHTMDGPPEDRGVNFRALEEVFRLRGERKGEMRYTLSLSMLEVYNETIRDLLAGKGKGVAAGGENKLDIRMAEDGSYDVPGLTLVEVNSLEEVWKLMNSGKGNRAVGAHDMNEHSSRSHSIVSLRVRGESVQGDKTLATVSKLHLIDLAGSERLSKVRREGGREGGRGGIASFSALYYRLSTHYLSTHFFKKSLRTQTDDTGDRLKEAQNINKSLSAVGDLINALGSKN